MGEEEKKAAEEEKRTAAAEKPKAEEEKPKAEEEKKDGGGGGGGGDGCEKKEVGEGEAAASEPPPPPPEEVVMKVYMHCEGCARKVRRALKGFEGVEDVVTDCMAGKVVAKGRKAAEDPLKVVDRVQRKTGRKVELISPPPPPPKPEKKEEDQKKEEDDKPKPEEKKEEPQVIDVVLKVYMHCDACAQEIKKRILKMKGVQSAGPELKASQVTVKGVFDPPKLVEYIYKRTGKQAVVITVEPVDQKPTADDGGAGEKKPDGGEVATDEKKSGEGEAKDGKKSDEKEKDNNSAEEGRDRDNKDEGSDGTVAATEEAAAAAMKVVELKKNEFYHYYPRYPVEYAHPPQFFSDENPNACSVM